MNCLEKYRRKLIRDINRNLRIVIERPEVDAVHDFRVGVKRLTALYYFLHDIDPAIEARRILKPYRRLFKSIGNIRDRHIALELIRNPAEAGAGNIKTMTRAVEVSIRENYRDFGKQIERKQPLSIRSPTLNATGISTAAILRHKPRVLEKLLQQVLQVEKNLHADIWHGKRILLKRYHHVLDAFQYCPGHALDEAEIKQIRVLEQLLGDWHDRVVTIELLQALPIVDSARQSLIAELKRQDKTLLDAARIYLHKFADWHAR